MKRTRIIEITVETEEVFVIRGSHGPDVPNCTECGESAALVTPAEAARLTGRSSLFISRRTEEGGVHYAETQDGFLLICINSLSNWRS